MSGERSQLIFDTIRVNNENQVVTMKSLGMPLQVLRRELRASQKDRTILTELNSVITKSINRVDGEEREILLGFWSDVTDTLDRLTTCQGGNVPGTTNEPKQVLSEMRSPHE